MRTPSGIVLIVIAGVLLGACATSRDTIVLLPRSDGSTGAIAASRDGQGEVLLDSAYASARSGITGKLRQATTDRETVEKKFGKALSAMPPPAKSFVVNFLSGGDELTEESKPALAQMLEELKARPSPEITVIGHTDLVGNDESNDALSLQRAGTVRDMLVALGVPAERIQAAGRGSREPLVPTAPGVDEARNRRVEVNVR